MSGKKGRIVSNLDPWFLIPWLNYGTRFGLRIVITKENTDG